MCINFIHYLSRMYEYEFIINSNTEEDIIRYKKESQHDQIEKLDLVEENAKAYNFPIRMYNLFKAIQKHNPSMIVMLGGDDLTESYSITSAISESIKIYILTLKYNVYLVCQNIGPFRKWLMNIVKTLLKNCIIYTRDEKTYDYLKDDLKLNYIYKSSDLGFIELPLQKREIYAELREKYNLVEGEYITLVPSGLVTKYSSNRDSYVESWVEIINGIRKIYETKDKKIVLLSHVLKPDHADDRKIIKEILGKIDNNKENVVPIVDEILPSEARLILGNGLFTITGRMHAAISTIQMLKPAIALSYGFKYDGVLGQMMGLNDLIIKSDIENLWTEKIIVGEMLEKVHYVLNNYDKIIDRINFNLNKNMQIVMDTLKHISSNIEG